MRVRASDQAASDGSIHPALVAVIAALNDLGYWASAFDMRWCLVAETDEQAREEYQPHLWYFMKKLLLLPPELGFPPGYITPRSYANVVGSFTRRNYMGTQNTWEDLMDGCFILAGSPATVREQLTHILKELGTGIMLCLFQIGSMPHELALKSMNLFASEVMPRVRAEVDQNLLQRPGAATTAGISQEERV